MKKFYQLLRSEDEQNTDLIIHGDITSTHWDESDTGSFDLAKELANISTPKITVHINSYGGEVSQGLGIYNLLKNFNGEVVTVNDGFACSAASIIFMAGTKRMMPKSSLLFIHNAWASASGDANEMRKTADFLEKVTQPSIEIYKQNSNLSEKDIKKMLDQETWLSADESMVYGFATHVIEDEPKQSLENHFLFKLVVKNKELEKQVQKELNSETKDSWESFFKPKKG